MPIIFGMGLGEIILLTITLTLFMFAIRMLLVTKPFQFGWLIAILFAPILGALIYLLYHLAIFIDRKRNVQ